MKESELESAGNCRLIGRGFILDASQIESLKSAFASTRMFNLGKGISVGGGSSWRNVHATGRVSVEIMHFWLCVRSSIRVCTPYSNGWLVN